MANLQTESVGIAASRAKDFVDRVANIRSALHEVIVGQDDTIDRLLVCALTGGHALLLGVPGLAKTLMVKALASSFDWKFSRIQFTPDLMPADITGYELLQMDASGTSSHGMVFRPGPVFGNLILADEINRAAPKTQSALLEAMAELHVTVGGKTYNLEEPFLVVATQNPIEQEGTYPLPEAQLDRFMMEIHIDYPTPEQEETIVTKTTSGPMVLPAARMPKSDFLTLRELIYAVPEPESVVKYAVHLAGATRPADKRAIEDVRRYVQWGAGPRASQFLVMGAKAWALLSGRTAPTVGDVRQVAMPVLRHRVIVNYHAIGDGVDSSRIVERLLEKVIG